LKSKIQKLRLLLNDAHLETKRRNEGEPSERWLDLPLEVAPVMILIQKVSLSTIALNFFRLLRACFENKI
jgi:hypothetical protein